MRTCVCARVFMGRVAVVETRCVVCSAATGYIVQELVGLPGYPGYTPNPVEAFSSVPPEALGQIFGFMALVEWNTNKGAWTMSTMCALSPPPPPPRGRRL